MQQLQPGDSSSQCMQGCVLNTEHGGCGLLRNFSFAKESIRRNRSQMEIYIKEEMLYIFLYIAPGDILS